MTLNSFFGEQEGPFDLELRHIAATVFQEQSQAAVLS